MSRPSEGSFFAGDAVRRLFLILCGVALFVAGALYLHLDRRHIDRAWLVTGGPAGPVAGETTAMRVTGRLLDERADVRVDVLQARVARGGEQTRIDGVVLIPGRPATVLVPTAALDGAEELILDVDGGAGPRTLSVGVDLMRSGPAELPEVGAGLIESGDAGHRLEVLPVGGALVAGVPVGVLARLTDADGRPLTAAQVTATPRGHKALSCTTDSAGLCTLGDIEASSRQVLDIHVVDEAGGESAHDVTLDPATVKAALSPAIVVLPPGADTPARFVVRSFYDEELIYCDLWGDGAVVWSETRALQDGVATLDVPVPAAGVWRVQCAYHPAMPGGAGATALAVRSAEGSEPIRAHAATADGGLRAWLGFVPADASLGAAGTARLLDFLGSRMRFEPQSAVVLLDTNAYDEAALSSDVASTKRTLLLVIGGIFAVMVLWMLLSVVFGYRSVRRGFNAFRRDGGDEDDEPEPGSKSLSRNQAMIQVVALILIIVLNVLAIVMLLRMVG